MKKIILLVSLAFLSFSLAWSKTADGVSATVKDSKTKEPVEFASVEFLNQKDSIIIGCITDSKGYFEVTPPRKADKIRIRYLGYQLFEAPIKEHDLGTLLLEENSRELNAVVVQGSARTNKIDRDVYYITKELRSGTISSQEILGKLNGVTYNRYDKSIAVNGNTHILILIDGIEKDQDMAKNLPSDRIERVEVIKDPVGKYATDGYTAVINIILKKDYSGIDAFITNTLFLDVVGTNGGDLFTQDAGNMNVTYTNKKLNIFSSAKLFSGNFNIPTQIAKQYGDRSSISTPMDFKHPNASYDPFDGKINVGADYAFSKKHSLSVEFRYSDNSESSSSTLHMVNSRNGSLLDSSDLFSKSQSKSENWQGTVTYKGTLDENNTIDADYRYNHSNGFTKSDSRQEAFSSATHIDQRGNYSRLNVNFNHQFSSNINLDLGYGNVYQQNTNTLNTASFTQDEYRNRFSIYISCKPTEKINAKFGGIVENYLQKNSEKKANNTVLLPYANIQYAPNTKVNFVAKYHAQSEYPEIDQLSSFKTAQDSLTWSLGNPLLKTNIDHSISLECNLMNFITLTPYYTFNNGKISNFVQEDPLNNHHYLDQYVNADQFKQYGASLSFTLPLGKSIFWQNRMDWNKSHIDYLQNANTLHNFTLNSTLVYVKQEKGLVLGTAMQKMQSKVIGIQGYSSDQNDLMLAFLQKSLLKNKLNMTLLYMLPVDFFKYEQPTLARSNTYYQKTTSSLNFIKNMVFVEFSYHFNAGKQVTKKYSDDESDTKKTKKKGLGL